MMLFVLLEIQTRHNKSDRRKCSICAAGINILKNVSPFPMTGPAQNGYVDVYSLPAQGDFVDINDETLPDALPTSPDDVTSFPVGNADLHGLQQTSFVSAPGQF